MNKHTIKLRVRYEETDQMGVVYYSNYLVWFEVARTEFFRAKGLDYRQLEQKHKIYLPAVDAYCRYRSPLRYDDQATVITKISDMSATRITFKYEVKKDGKIAATGITKHAFVNKKGKPIRIPTNIKKALS